MYLEEMRERGFDEEFEGIVTNPKKKHSNRSAFLDEMKTFESCDRTAL